MLPPFVLAFRAWARGDRDGYRSRRGQGGPFCKRSAQRLRFFVARPSLNLPKGGGAIRGIGEKFAANPVTGTGSVTVERSLGSGGN